MLNNNEVNADGSDCKQPADKVEHSEVKTKEDKTEIINLDNVCKNIVALIEDTIKEKENNRFTSDEVDFLKIVLNNSPQTCRNLENTINNIIYGDTYY